MKPLVLTGEVARRAACRYVMEAPIGHVVTIKEPTRKLILNAKLHAVLGDIASQIGYHGKRRSVDFWRGLFVSGWEVAIGRKPEIVPGLEGEFINIRQSTTTMSNKDVSSLIEYVTAYAVSNGVVLSEPEAQIPERYAA